jgi:alkylation response protein AidB-like acyl-CoA dehydrogenase
MGINGSSTRQVFFEGRSYSKRKLVRRNWKRTQNCFQCIEHWSLYKLGLLAVGGCKEGVRDAVKYANERSNLV